jgi:hypothetical protein
LPQGRHWILSIGDLLTPGQPCAIYDQKSFNTRGRKGQILKATFYPQQDILDNHPTTWCTGSTAASSWGVFAASDTRNDQTAKHYHMVTLRFFTIS